ncbi:MAG: hypothetical protein SRB1_01980 [Desulfobacteraceae bacterium Eth-SRB1]|nr:MAG: hypothetical protein SRB1_01980 [Desulfobacteraceae bacterium Eth-SRB1]
MAQPKFFHPSFFIICGSPCLLPTVFPLLPSVFRPFPFLTLSPSNLLTFFPLRLPSLALPLLTSDFRPLSSVIRPLSSVLCPPPSVLRPLSSDFCHPSSDLCLLSSVLRHPSSALCPPPSVFCHLTSDFCPPPSVLCPIFSFLNPCNLRLPCLPRSFGKRYWG